MRQSEPLAICLVCLWPQHNLIASRTSRYSSGLLHAAENYKLHSVHHQWQSSTKQLWLLTNTRLTEGLTTDSCRTYLHLVYSSPWSMHSLTATLAGLIKSMWLHHANSYHHGKNRCAELSAKLGCPRKGWFQSGVKGRPLTQKSGLKWVSNGCSLHPAMSELVTAVSVLYFLAWYWIRLFCFNDQCVHSQ